MSVTDAVFTLKQEVVAVLAPPLTCSLYQLTCQTPCQTLLQVPRELDQTTHTTPSSRDHAHRREGTSPKGRRRQAFCFWVYIPNWWV